MKHQEMVFNLEAGAANTCVMPLKLDTNYLRLIIGLPSLKWLRISKRLCDQLSLHSSHLVNQLYATDELTQCVSDVLFRLTQSES